MSSRNFFNGRLHLQDSIYLRYSFSAIENAAITLEDLKRPQVESNDAQAVCGRIDFSGFEPDQLLKQWDDIMCTSCNLTEVQQMLPDDDDKSISFTLMPAGFALQQFPYGPDNRTVCGMETMQAIKVDIEAGVIRFVRERYEEDLLSTVIVTNSSSLIEAAEEGKRISPHVHPCAIITLDQNHGMKRLDSFIRLLSQTKNFMFPSFEKLCCRKNNFFQ
jgi:hypothetical protein